MAPKISPDTPLRAAGAEYMREQNARITKNLPGTLAGEDPEALHDLRVATRRMRAAMRVFERCFDPDDFRTWYRRVSRLTKALGEVRDMDVQRAAIEPRREGLPDEAQADISAWLEWRDAERETEREAMAAVLTGWRDEGRSEEFDRVLKRMERPEHLRARITEVLALLREEGSDG